MTVDLMVTRQGEVAFSRKGTVILYIKGHLRNNVKTLTSNLNTDLTTIKEATTSQLQVT
jgi:hypothetical protein